MKITVITVARNAQKTIVDCLKSVAEQDYEHIEHIVIDGQSSDETVALVRKHSSRVAHLVSEPDDGLYDAMNKGVRLSSGDVVGFLNADDIYSHSGVISRIAKEMLQSNLDAVYADVCYVDPDNLSRVVRRWRSQDYFPGRCFQGWMPAHPTLYLRRSCFKEIGEFRIDMGHQADLEFCARAFEIHNIQSKYFAENWVLMRAGGISNSSVTRRIIANWRSFKALQELGMRKNPVSFFYRKFAHKLPGFFLRG